MQSIAVVERLGWFLIIFECFPLHNARVER